MWSMSKCAIYYAHQAPIGTLQQSYDYSSFSHLKTPATRLRLFFDNMIEI